MIWLGFAINFTLSVLALVFVLTLDEFRATHPAVVAVGPNVEVGASWKKAQDCGLMMIAG
jgi:hypothetical protein